jgi:hypothetical protein
MLAGLLKSYSRGAWIATACGWVYLACAWRRSYDASRTPPAIQFLGSRRVIVRLAVIIVSLFLVVVWDLRHSDQRLARRISSVTNLNDFSWRNRVVALVGALQMMGEHPWLGVGWNLFERVYNEFYRPPKLVEGMAIVLNDYLVTGMSLGLPALVCLLGFLWQKWPGADREHRSPSSVAMSADAKDRLKPGQQAHSPEREEWDKAICRAGFLVLAVGFVPERGLFYLCMGVPFWILLELGSGGKKRHPPLSQS